MTDSLDTVEFIEGQSGVYVLFFGGSAISEQQKIRIKWTLELERPPIIRDGREYIGVKCEVSTAWMVGDEAKQTSVSSATISRVNRCLVYGDGGYKTVIDRMKEGTDD